MSAPTVREAAADAHANDECTCGWRSWGQPAPESILIDPDCEQHAHLAELEPVAS